MVGLRADGGAATINKQKQEVDLLLQAHAMEVMSDLLNYRDLQVIFMEMKAVFTVVVH